MPNFLNLEDKKYVSLVVAQSSIIPCETRTWEICFTHIVSCWDVLIINMSYVCRICIETTFLIS